MFYTNAINIVLNDVFMGLGQASKVPEKTEVRVHPALSPCSSMTLITKKK